MTQHERTKLTKTLTIRLPQSVLTRLRQLAVKDQRKLADYVRMKLDEVSRRENRISSELASVADERSTS